MLFDVIEEANQAIAEHVDKNFEMIDPSEAGLDTRAAYRIWISDEAIVVRKSDDGRMQYYGGFEYVDKEYRKEMGDWVIYFADDERVAEHIDTWKELEVSE